MYARSTTTRKNITLTLVKKFQFKFAHYLMEPFDKKIILKDTHKILCSDYTNIKNNKLNKTALQYSCYSELKFNGILYKKGYYLTKQFNEMGLFKIIEIIYINKPDILFYILAKEIQLNGFSSHYESFIVNNSEEEEDSCHIFNLNEFNGPPINVTSVSSGQKMIRLKEFY